MTLTKPALGCTTAVSEPGERETWETAPPRAPHRRKARASRTPDEPANQVARLGEVGVRAARVAHELKVPVSVISGSLENLEQYLAVLVRYVRATNDRLGDAPELAALADELGLPYVLENVPALLTLCRDSSEQLNHIVQQIKGYAQPAATPFLTRPVDLAAAVATALAMVTASRDRTPTVHWELSRHLVVRGAPESIRQVFVNILGNAFDAVHGIAAAQVWITGRRVADAGEWAEIRIRDNGPGVPEGIRGRIFDPFFTTKSHGVGLGLGLSITRDMIEAHGGSVTLADTAPEAGATFVTRIPVALST